MTNFQLKAFLFLACYSTLVVCFDSRKRTTAAEDQIQNLPGVLAMPSFHMYSGYLHVSATKRFHYWYNSCSDPSSNKLIIWFNGGPGCSSLDGLFTENGPFQFEQGSERPRPNKYSWNKLAHTLYIESPAGVGFSFDNDQNPIWDDNITTTDNFEALKEFFSKFPHLQSMNIYVSGESYAGVYVPLLTKKLLNVRAGSGFRYNIKGLMIGNGLLDIALNQESLLYFLYYHGLFGADLWNQLQRYCCEKNGKCSFSNFYNEDCLLKVTQINRILSNTSINLYNLYSSCYSGSQSSQIRLNNLRSKIQNKNSISSRLKVHNLRKKSEVLKARKLGLVPPCSNVLLMTKYLNKREVQDAIHVKNTTWEVCSEKVLTQYDQQHREMSSTLKSILDLTNDFKMLIYYGDADMACNHLGGEWFVDQLGYPIVMPRRMWMIEDDDGSYQVAGFYKSYDRLTFAIVKGAGHMVPADKPREAFAMIQRFLNDEPL